LNVVAIATNWSDAYEQIRLLRPDVALIDASSREFMPHVTSVRELGIPQVVAFAVGEDEGEVIACAEAGVTAFVERSASIDDLIAAVTRGARGELQLSPRTAAVLLRRIRRVPEAMSVPRGAHLTAREREIWAMLRNKMSNKEIAAQLGLSVPTVKNHVHHLLAKLGVHRRVDALLLTIAVIIQ
jgi:DNA-binding NarL/FixJ family response regulator